MSAPPPALAPPKPRPYRRYLTSALHTRFVHAVLFAVLQGLAIACWTGHGYFWSWFPFGPAGLKAALFSMCSLFVFILQLATLDVGRRTSASPFASVRSIVFGFSTYQTLLWYTISAWWFCEAFIWSVPDTKQLGWVIRGDNITPDRLNERPIYLRFFFTVLAVVQSGIHLTYNHSSLYIPVSKPDPSPSGVVTTHPIPSIQVQLQKKLPYAGKHALVASAITTVTAPFVYKTFFRNIFWRIHLAFAKPFFSISHSDAHPPHTYFIGKILGEAFVVGVFLSVMWELSSYSLMTYLKQEPLKNGLPLSAKSKDPNGTLLNGLTAKRDVVRTFAFWELAIIAQKYPDRRKAIFADFERIQGPMWRSMLTAALGVVAQIDDRILMTRPPAPTNVPQNPPQITALPKIAKEARKQPIFASLPPPTTKTRKVEDFLAKTNKSLGQSSDPWHPPVEKVGQELLEYTKSVRQLPQASQWSTILSSTPIGGFFVTDVPARISGVVLGSPVANVAIVVDAVEAVTKMLVASLNEDDYGKVVQTVPDTVKQFTRTINLIESFLSAQRDSLGDGAETQLEEVLIVLGKLKSSLRELLMAFQVFLNDVGLSIKDLNDARKASEERSVVPPPQKRPQPPPQSQLEQQQQPTQQPEMERVSSGTSGSQRIQLGSGTRREPLFATNTDRRSLSQQQQRKPIEAKAANGSSSGNVFGAKDFNSAPSRRREVEMVR